MWTGKEAVNSSKTQSRFPQWEAHSCYQRYGNSLFCLTFTYPSKILFGVPPNQWVKRKPTKKVEEKPYNKDYLDLAHGEKNPNVWMLGLKIDWKNGVYRTLDFTFDVLAP